MSIMTGSQQHNVHHHPEAIMITYFGVFCQFSAEYFRLFFSGCFSFANNRSGLYMCIGIVSAYDRGDLSLWIARSNPVRV
jgi:hypothetical protein